ncbi:MAG: hypothetical protein ACXACY_25250, partial [Candidatus Hodarchaeales archaeon]
RKCPNCNTPIKTGRANWLITKQEMIRVDAVLYYLFTCSTCSCEFYFKQDQVVASKPGSDANKLQSFDDFFYVCDEKS